MNKKNTDLIYTHIKKNKIKAWKKHRVMQLNLIVPKGNVLFVFTDSNGDFREEIIGEKNKVRLTVPPGLWFGFKGLYAPYSIMMNVADIPHDPTEIERKTMHQIKYDWKLK